MTGVIPGSVMVTVQGYGRPFWFRNDCMAIAVYVSDSCSEPRSFVEHLSELDRIVDRHVSAAQFFQLRCQKG